MDNNYGAAIWSAIESNVGVVCASLPTFKPLIDRLFPRLLGRTRGPSDITPPDVSAVVKRGYTRKISESEIELEHSTGWKDSYTGNYCGDGSYTTCATAERLPPLGPESSEEHIGGRNAQGINAGIWTSTSVVVSHDRA